MTRTAVPLPTVSPTGKQSLDALLDAKVAEAKVPALFFGAANAQGTIYFACKGDRVVGEPAKGQVDEDTTLQLFSMTKLVVSIAVLQLVERGLVDLDDPALVEKQLPELAAMPIVEGWDDEGNIKQRKRTKPMTVRHLLTHTSGLAYGFTRPDIYLRWEKENLPKGALHPDADIKSFQEPLVHEPGDEFTYSLGIDWAGILVQRLTGKKLGDYFDQYIFGPLGIKTISFYPTTEFREKMMATAGLVDGKLVPIDGIRPVAKWTPEMIGIPSGGAGLLGTAKDYLRFLQGILASREPGGIITPQTFDLLFKDSLPPTRPHRKQLGATMAGLGWGSDGEVAGQTGGHSVAMPVILADSEHGRKKGSAGWGGIAQTPYWIDPETGIAAICATQLFSPDGPAAFKPVYNEFEKTLYKALA